MTVQHDSLTHHHFTIDVEEYFHATALEPFIPRSGWASIPRRSPRLVNRILEHLAEEGVRATFFVLGWLAEREPAMVRAIKAGGHEIASHGWSHRRLEHLTPDTFREEVRNSRALLEQLSGEPVVGFRAPSFSIRPGDEWVFDILIEEGYRYDSSIFPVRVHPSYGYPGASRDPYVIARPSGRLAEVPPATLRVAGLTLPAAGGAYLRFFPAALISAALASAGRRGTPGTLYLHPWEFDREMAPTPGPWLTRLRMSGGIRQVERRVASIMKRFRFLPMRDTVEQLLLSTTGGPD